MSDTVADTGRPDPCEQATCYFGAPGRSFGSTLTTQDADGDGLIDLIVRVAGVAANTDETPSDAGFWILGAPWTGGFAALQFNARIAEDDVFKNTTATALPDVTGDSRGEIALGGSARAAIFSGVEGLVTHADAAIVEEDGTPFFVVHDGHLVMDRGLLPVPFTGTLGKDDDSPFATTWAYEKGLRTGGLDLGFVFDADRDGDEEVVLYHSGQGTDFQSLLVAPFTPGFHQLDAWPHTVLEEDSWPVGVADLDGDGVGDLFGLALYSMPDTIWVLTDSLDSYPNGIGIRIESDESDEFVSATSGDYNGDGAADIAFCSNRGDERVFFGPLPHGTIDIDAADVFLQSPSVPSGVETTSADLDGDGKDELIIGHPRDTKAGSSAGMVIIHWGSAM